MKVAASSSELGPTRAPRIKAGRLDDDNHDDDEERGTQNGKDAFFSPLFSPKKTTLFPLSASPPFVQKNPIDPFVRSAGVPPCPQMSGKREESEKRRNATVFWSAWKTEETAVTQPRKRTCRRVATSSLDVILPAVLG